MRICVLFFLDCISIINSKYFLFSLFLFCLYCSIVNFIVKIIFFCKQLQLQDFKYFIEKQLYQPDIGKIFIENIIKQNIIRYNLIYKNIIVGINYKYNIQEVIVFFWIQGKYLLILIIFSIFYIIVNFYVYICNAIFFDAGKIEVVLILYILFLFLIIINSLVVVCQVSFKIIIIIFLKQYNNYKIKTLSRYQKFKKIQSPSLFYQIFFCFLQ
eukprot:TRINITY_DN5931_c2_g3_i1.p3 TRINITY_DN5931_c2_g3~~TRINITY_DN5931_c2_g3_i1.p3  ORF type:complete len:213 (-),score=-13.63 TRINITY_DN5931_c2_g3_i1:100-738(-)